MESNQNKIRYK